MAKGVYKTNKKDGSVYYRVSITYKNKHISIGSYDDENTASQVYCTACDILLSLTYIMLILTFILHHTPNVILIFLILSS